MSTAEKDQMTHLCRHLDVHVSTLLMITLTVLTTRQLSFAALALLVDAATFTRTLKQNRKYVASVTFPCNHKVFSGLTPPSPDPNSHPKCFCFLWGSAALLRFLWTPLVLLLVALVLTGRHQFFNVDGCTQRGFGCGEALRFRLLRKGNSTNTK